MLLQTYASYIFKAIKRQVELNWQPFSIFPPCFLFLVERNWEIVEQLDTYNTYHH